MSIADYFERYTSSMGYIAKHNFNLDQSSWWIMFRGPSNTFYAFVSRPFVAHNCTSMRRPFFHGNTALSRTMTQAFSPIHSCAFGARTELIIGTWNGSALGSFGGEADARPRAHPTYCLCLSHSHILPTTISLFLFISSLPLFSSFFHFLHDSFTLICSSDFWPSDLIHILKN